MAKTGGFADGGIIDLDLIISEDRRKREILRLVDILDTEEATIRYGEVILGIERRWDAVMKRRSEPKRKVWQIEVIADLPNN